MCALGTRAVLLHRWFHFDGNAAEVLIEDMLVVSTAHAENVLLLRLIAHLEVDLEHRELHVFFLSLLLTPPPLLLEPRPQQLPL